MIKDSVMIIEDNTCIVVIRRYGYGDQSKLHEYMLDDSGVYFDNEGYDSNRFTTRSDLITNLKSRFTIKGIIPLDSIFNESKDSVDKVNHP